MKDNASFLYFLHLDPVFQFSLLIMFQSAESSLSTVFTCSFLLLRNSKWLPAIPTKFSGLAWFNDLIPCKQYPSISSCSQKRAFLSGAAGFFNEGHYCSLTFLLLSRTIPPTFWPYLLHEVFPDHSWKRIIFTFLNRYACLFVLTSFTSSSQFTFFSPNFWLLTLASEVEGLVAIKVVYIGQQRQRSNRTSVISTWMTKDFNTAVVRVPQVCFWSTSKDTRGW